MAMLTGYTFCTVDGAQQMLHLAQQHLTVQDAALVIWPDERKKPIAEQLRDGTENGALGETFWGMLFGLIFFVPFFGMAVGAATGALTGHFSTYGIDKAFIVQTRNKVTVGTSALFLMANAAMVDKVTDAAKANGLKFQRFHANLSKEQLKQLKEDFAA